MLFLRVTSAVSEVYRLSILAPSFCSCAQRDSVHRVVVSVAISDEFYARTNDRHYLVSTSKFGIGDLGDLPDTLGPARDRKKSELARR